LLEKGATCGRAMLQQIQVPSPEQISAMVRACLAIQQQSIEDRLLPENCPKEGVHKELVIHLLKAEVQRGLCMKGAISITARKDQRNLSQQSVRRKPYQV